MVWRGLVAAAGRAAVVLVVAVVWLRLPGLCLRLVVLRRRLVGLIRRVFL